MGKYMTVGLMIVFTIIGITFLLFGGYWWFAMDEYKEIIELSDFTKDLVSIIQSFFVVMGLVFLLSGIILFLMSYEYERDD